LPVILLVLTLCLAVAGVFATWFYFTIAVDPVAQNVGVGMGGFYYDIAIQDVAVVTGTSVSAETSARDFPLSIKTTATGNKNQKIVYKITARNYSNSVTYVYSDATVTSGTGVSLSSSLDLADTAKIPSVKGTNYVSGTPIAPGDTFVFYATYTLTGNLSDAELLVKYNFTPVVYTVTYLENNVIYAEDCITNNNAVYTVRSDYPTISGSNVKFEYWMNASGVKAVSYPAGNTNDYTLTAKWNNIYSIVFVDADGSVVHQEHITVDTKALSAEGQAVVTAKLAQLQAEVAGQDVAVSWSSYSFGKAGDIIVRAEYTYAGALKIVPVKNEGGVDDGIVDYYYVAPLDTLTGTEHKSIVIPGKVGKAPVRIVERVTNEAGDNDWNNFNKTIETITIGEGVEELKHNSLSYTPELNTVYLPSTLKTMGKNTFSRNTPSDNKKLTIYYPGTMADWEKLVNNSDDSWDGGLKNGSLIICSDGYYHANAGELFGAVIGRSWKKHRHLYGTNCPSGCPTNAIF